MPALSPDGKRIAFVWRGDVWLADTAGGEAKRVTDHVELDAYPLFSPDGNWLAFSSLRNGNWDIYLVPAMGGQPRQLTRSGGNEIATGWSPDGKRVLFSGQRDIPRPSVFSIDVQTGAFTKLTEDYMGLNRPTFSPDGLKLLFERSGFPWTRPRYHGSAAAQLWTMDVLTGKRTQIASNGLQHLWPQFAPDGQGVLCVTVGEETPSNPVLGKPVTYTDSVQKTPNLYRYPLGGGRPSRITSFTGGAVRCPSVAARSSDVAFEYETDLYLLPAGQKEARKLAFTCTADDKLSPRQRQVIQSNEVEESEISPDGKTIGFKLRGDLWTTPVEKPKTERNAEDAKRLTDYPGFDGDFVWAEGGQSLFFISDRDGISRLYRRHMVSGEIQPVWTGKEDARAPWTTPDGKSVLFWVAGTLASAEAGLWLVPADRSAPARQLVTLPGAAQGEFTVSPDQKWLAFTRRGTESPGTNIYLVPVDGSQKPENITKLNAFHSQPRFSPDGKHLFFASDRDGAGLYVLSLQLEPARADEQELKWEKPTAPVTVSIEFADIETRIRRLISQPVDADLSITDDGLFLFVSGGDAYTASYDGKETQRRTFTGGIGQLRSVEGGKKIAYQRGGQLFVHPLAAPGAPIPFRAVWERDVRAERKAALDEFWRIYNRRFHDPHFHGRDWAAIKKRYEPLLASVDTRDEMAILLNMMVGELDASHAEVSTAPGGSPSPETRSLGIYFDYTHTGPGIKIKDVPPRAPGTFTKTRLNPGEYIMAIDGTPVSLAEDLYTKLNDKGERDFELLVNSRPSLVGVRVVQYKALSGGEWSTLHYRNRIETRRKSVAKLSEGRIGYVHIAGMGLENRERFEKEFYEAAEGKSAMIIDVRENGGGNIGDTLLSWLAIKPYGTYLPRDGFPVKSPTPNYAPRAAWDRPIVVLMAESSFSNAEMFPYGMRASGLATLVGMPTPGYVIWTWESRLIDGTGIRIPAQSVFRKDGTSLENRGEEPDIKIPWTTEDYLTGKDPQLEKGVGILLKK
jgi:tricorn protease